MLGELGSGRTSVVKWDNVVFYDWLFWKIHSFIRLFVVVDRYWLLIKSRVAPSIMNQLPSLFVWWKKRRRNELTIILICFCLWLLWWLCVDDWHCRAPLASSSSSSSRKVSVSLWDFHRDSGYETSHQFFVTDNTIVVIVFDMSLPIAAARLHFWLTSVRLLVCSWPWWSLSSSLSSSCLLFR